jgi:phosphoribosylanthranilate isomerase
MVRVKVCGMNNIQNVRDVAMLNPDFIGFIFYPGSPRYVGDNPEMLLFDSVPDSVGRIGVFFNAENHLILEQSIKTGLDMVQLHGSELPIACSQLKSSGLIIIKAFSIGADFNFELLREYIPVCDYFLFDTKGEKPGGTGSKFPWTKLNEYTFDKPFFLSGGIGPEDSSLKEEIMNKGLYAVDINSRFESSAGIKDTTLVKTFIEAIKKNQQ